MICPFRQFKDILGKPFEGIHSMRFLDTAIVDYTGTILLAMIGSFITKMPLVLTTIIAFVITIIIHMLFGVKTNTVEYLALLCF